MSADAKQGHSERSQHRILIKNICLIEHAEDTTNHLDIYSLEKIESTLKCYQGSMIVVSHDQNFLENIGITNLIYAPFNG